MLCISGIVDDVMFSYNGGATILKSISSLSVQTDSLSVLSSKTVASKQNTEQ